MVDLFQLLVKLYYIGLTQNLSSALVLIASRHQGVILRVLSLTIKLLCLMCKYANNVLSCIWWCSVCVVYCVWWCIVCVM